jgi:VanZ family protein
MNAIVGCFLICCTVAIFDEAIQNVSPGRAAMIFDALLNLFGVATGALIGILTEKTTK